MKDYLSYRIFSEAGIESPLVSYVSLTVNGENAGLYIAIEEIGRILPCAYCQRQRVSFTSLRPNSLIILTAET